MARDFSNLKVKKQFNSVDAAMASTLSTNRSKTNQIIKLSPDKLIDDPDNRARYGDYEEEIESLSVSMQEHGFLGVILAFEENGGYMIASGHRRKYAAIRAGIKEVPVAIIEKPKHEYDRIIQNIALNLNSREYTPMKTARLLEDYFQAMKEKREEDPEILGDSLTKRTAEIIAESTGMSSSTISKYRSLLKLIPPLQEQLEEKDNLVPWSALSSAATMSEEMQELLYQCIQFLLETRNPENLNRKVFLTLISDIKNGKIRSLDDINPNVKKKQIHLQRSAYSKKLLSSSNVYLKMLGSKEEIDKTDKTLKRTLFLIKEQLEIVLQDFE